MWRVFKELNSLALFARSCSIRAINDDQQRGAYNMFSEAQGYNHRLRSPSDSPRTYARRIPTSKMTGMGIVARTDRIVARSICIYMLKVQINEAALTGQSL